MNTNAYKVSLNYKQILELVKQLPKKDKAKLSKELAKEAVDAKLTRLLESFATDEISEEMIAREVEEVRSEIYGRKKKN
jgi:dihydroneopterin aldolase